MGNYRVSTNANRSSVTTQGKTDKKQQKQRKMNQFKLLTLKQEFLKISVSLHTAFAVETRLTEGQWLEEQLKTVKLPMFRAGTRRPTVSRTEGQHLAPLKAFIKNKGSE
jgi:hypothetical protein